MPSFNDPGTQATALRLLDRFGQAGLVVRAMRGSGPAYDPGDLVPTPYACRLCVRRFDNKDIDGTLIKSSDLKIYVAAKGLWR